MEKTRNYATLAGEVKTYAREHKTTLKAAKKALNVKDWQFAYAAKKAKAAKKTNQKAVSAPVSKLNFVGRTERNNKMFMVVGTPEEISRTIKSLGF